MPTAEPKYDLHLSGSAARQVFAALVRTPPRASAQELRLALDDALNSGGDDITPQLNALRDLFAAYAPPDAFDRAQKTIAEIIGHIGKLQREVWVSRNSEKVNSDQPPAFAGQPQRGGELAADSTLHKNLSRIAFDPPYGVQPPRRTPPLSAADVDNFTKAYPGAARIGHV
jgi:hypothetical protein